ncbi:hypothetical protein KQX54_008503 [Cotesia glomerata]|uniref:Gustatory receptor n=1 Tax=Cotesia glomerata TaxID=32391 RepID=A0AAV7INM1_COTGL|nr:hypothetical protein KQX54_008503 [Cotesia glomerata]
MNISSKIILKLLFYYFKILGFIPYVYYKPGILKRSKSATIYTVILTLGYSKNVMNVMLSRSSFIRPRETILAVIVDLVSLMLEYIAISMIWIYSITRFNQVQGRHFCLLNKNIGYLPEVYADEDSSMEIIKIRFKPREIDEKLRKFDKLDLDLRNQIKMSNEIFALPFITANKKVKILHESWALKRLDGFKEMLKSISLHQLQEPVEIKFHDALKLNHKLFYKMAGVTTTYLIIMIQLDQQVQHSHNHRI